MRVCQFRHSRTEQDVFYTCSRGLSRGNFGDFVPFLKNFVLNIDLLLKPGGDPRTIKEKSPGD